MVLFVTCNLSLMQLGMFTTSDSQTADRDTNDRKTHRAANSLPDLHAIPDTHGNTDACARTNTHGNIGT